MNSQWPVTRQYWYIPAEFVSHVCRLLQRQVQIFQLHSRVEEGPVRLPLLSPHSRTQNNPNGIPDFVHIDNFEIILRIITEYRTRDLCFLCFEWRMATPKLIEWTRFDYIQWSFRIALERNDSTPSEPHPEPHPECTDNALDERTLPPFN